MSSASSTSNTHAWTKPSHAITIRSMNDTERAQVESAAQGFATQLGHPYFDTRPHIDINNLVGKLTVIGMQAYGIVPVALEGNKLTLATSEETDRGQLES